MNLDTGIHNPHTAVLSFTICYRFIYLQELDTPEKLEGFLNAQKNPVSRAWQRQVFEQGYDAPAFADAVHAFAAFLELLNGRLTGNDWLAGEDLTLADLDVAPYIHRLDMLGLAPMIARYPHVEAWLKQVRERPSWRVAVTEKHLPQWTGLMAETGKDAWPQVEKILQTS